MTSFLRNIVVAPRFAGDELKNHQARLLNIILLMGFAMSIITVVLNLADSTTPPRNYLIDLVAMVIFGFLQYLLRQKKIILVGAALTIFTGLFAVLVVASEGTLRSPGAFLLFVGVILAVVLFGLRGMIISFLSCGIAIYALWAAETMQLLPPPKPSLEWIDYVVVMLLVLGIAGLVYSAYHSMLTSFELSQQEIVRRKKTEEQLRSRSRAVEQSPASIVITDLEGRITYVNPRFSEVTGYTPQEVLGQNPRILQSGLTPRETYQDLWANLEAGQTWRGEFINQKKDGSLYYEVATLLPIVDENGAIADYLAVKEDVTEARRIQQFVLWQRDLAQSLAETDTLHEALATCLSAAIEISQLDSGGIFLVKENGYYLEVWNGLGAAFVQRGAATLADSSGWRMALDGQTITIPVQQVQADAHLMEEGFKSYALVPVMHHAHVIACFFLASHKVEMIGSDAVVPVTQIALQVGNALMRVKANEDLQTHMAQIQQLQAELKEQALRDPLTGLHNRRYLNEVLPREVSRAQRENSCLYFIVCDLDHFKSINDRYGHTVGDDFLKEFASVFSTSARASDIVCRYGGEEFLLVLCSAQSENARLRADEIRKKCAQFQQAVGNQVISATISIGMAVYPEHGQDVEQLISLADQAMYVSKAAGRNRVTVWSKDLENPDAVG